MTLGGHSKEDFVKDLPEFILAGAFGYISGKNYGPKAQNLRNANRHLSIAKRHGQESLKRYSQSKLYERTVSSHNVYNQIGRANLKEAITERSLYREGAKKSAETIGKIIKDEGGKKIVETIFSPITNAGSH